MQGLKEKNWKSFENFPKDAEEVHSYMFLAVCVISYSSYFPLHIDIVKIWLSFRRSSSLSHIIFFSHSGYCSIASSACFSSRVKEGKRKVGLHRN